MSPDRGSPRDVRTGELALQRTDSGLAVLTISGEHDLNTVPDLRSQFDALLSADGGIVVDLSAASFIDSSILGVLLEARRRARDAGRGFAVQQTGGEEAVTRVLEITGLRSELPVHDTRSDAVAQAGGGSGQGG